MKTRIAITGVTGYSGRYIAREAERRGYEILGLTNSPGAKKINAGILRLSTGNMKMRWRIP